ncbi:MAG: hypothetical protein ACODAU_02345 [Myxococcota bacterium]
MARIWRLGCLALAVALFWGCSDSDADSGDGGVPDGGDPPAGGDCNPVDPSVCALPFPSSFYLEEDASSGSEYRVSFGSESLPRHAQAGHMDPTYLNEKDGFSILTPMIFYFDDVSLEGTVTHEDIGAYAEADAKTVLIDTETGERVPHWVEQDATAPSPDEAVVFIRPAVPLEFERRYVVGIRGLQTTGGSAVQPSAAFQALRDGDTTGDAAVDGQLAHYESDVFPVLADEGFARDELQLAWDFVTKSRESTIGQAIAARDDAMALWGEDGPAYTVESEDFDCDSGGDGGIGRELRVEMTVPLYTETDEPGTMLTRDADGLPVQNGTTTADFIVRIPCSVIDAGTPAPLLQYGHGLLGGYGEARTGWLSQFADTYGYVVFAANWKGMADEDTPAILDMINTRPGSFNIIPERSVQGFVEFLGAAAVMTGALADDDAVKLGDPATSVIDPDALHYYGNSQGGILGSAYTALSPYVTRGVLGVGGMPYSVLLPRSVDFDPFFSLFQLHYADHRERMLIIAGTVQMLWDLGEGAGFSHDMDKDVLLQVAINDHQVTTLGAHIQARAWGARTVMPETRPVWGVPEEAPPFEGSALVEFLYNDLNDEPFEARPPEDEEGQPSNGDPHECPRRDPGGQEQADLFLRTGTVDHFCDDICDDVLQADCR